MIDTEVQPGAETPAGNDDVHADVRAAFAQHAGTETQEPAAAETEPAQTQERARNERGQFIRADGTVDPDQSPAPAVTDTDKPVENIVQPSTAAEPPTSWSADAKAEWSKLSPALQQAVAKRESEISEGARRWSEKEKSYDEMLTPVRAAAQRAGIDEREGLQKLIAANDFLERDPQAAIVWLAQTYGVDLSKVPAEQPKASQPQVDPVVRQLHQTVSSLQQSIEARETADLAQTINQFASQPGHEHFEAVKADMGRMLQTGQAKDMQDAYDKAIWANPDIRTKLIADQNAAAETSRKAQQQATVDKARRGAISTSGSPAGGPASAPAFAGETVEDAVRAAFQQHRA